MDGQNKESNAQNWELEVTCKNKAILDDVVNALLEIGVIGFEVETVDIDRTPDRLDGRYIVFMECAWFHNLKELVDKLAQIENKHEYTNEAK